MLGSELRKLRRGELDMTQEALGAQLGKTSRTISDYEKRTNAVPNAIAIAVKGLVTARQLEKAGTQ
jgi:predicted transcriptional regulator